MVVAKGECKTAVAAPQGPQISLISRIVTHSTLTRPAPRIVSEWRPIGRSRNLDSQSEISNLRQAGALFGAEPSASFAPCRK
jgi:hypothetical protein